MGRFADDQIAAILHHRRLRTSKGLSFRARHVTNLRRCNGIEGHTRAKLEAQHVYSARQATQIFGVTQRTVESWLSTGLLRGTQVTKGAPWRIEITPEDRERLCPQEMPSDWVTLKRAANALRVTQQTVLNRLKRGELEGVRVRTGHAQLGEFVWIQVFTTRRTHCLFNQSRKLFEVMQYATQYPRCGGTVRVIAESTTPAHSCARGFSASLHVTEPVLIAQILEHRDSSDDFRGRAPAGGARAPPALSLH